MEQQQTIENALGEIAVLLIVALLVTMVDADINANRVVAPPIEVAPRVSLRQRLARFAQWRRRPALAPASLFAPPA